MNQASIAAPMSFHEVTCTIEPALLVDCASAPVCVNEELEPAPGEGGPSIELPPFEAAEGVIFSGAFAARRA